LPRILVDCNIPVTGTPPANVAGGQEGPRDRHDLVEQRSRHDDASELVGGQMPRELAHAFLDDAARIARTALYLLDVLSMIAVPGSYGAGNRALPAGHTMRQSKTQEPPPVSGQGFGSRISISPRQPLDDLCGIRGRLRTGEARGGGSTAEM
jgi:hypothetical protein